MKKINNYKELVLEKIRLQEELLSQKKVIKAEFNSLMDKIYPVIKVVGLVRNLSNKIREITSFFRGKRTSVH